MKKILILFTLALCAGLNAQTLPTIAGADVAKSQMITKGDTTIFLSIQICGPESSMCEGQVQTTPNPVCPGGFSMLTASQTLGLPPVTFLWDNGFTGQSQSLQIFNQTSGWVQGTAFDGCSWFVDYTIFINSQGLNPTISGNLSFCNGASTTLTSSGTGSFSWTGPNGFSASTATINVNMPGTYTVTVNNGGCSGTASVNVTMSQAPVVSIAGPTGFCPNSNATLTASSSVPGSNFSWNTGQSGPVLTTSTSGTYTVTATAPGGCSATTSKTITAFSAPSPKIKVSYSNNVATLSVSAGLNAVWSTGANTPSITNVPNGTYSVTVTDQQTGCIATSTPVELDIAPCAPPCPLPIANFTFTINGPLVTFTNTSSGATSYSWLFGDGSNSMAMSPSHAYQPGTYQVKLTATNACGSIETIQTITIQCPPPTANFTFVANGATAVFTNTSTGNGLTYAWDFGDGATSMLPNPSHTYASSGNYTVTLKVTNSCGAIHQCSKLVSVFFCAPLDAQFNLPQSGGLTLQFTNTSVGTNLTYLWTFGDGGTSSDEDPTHTYGQSGVYLVKLKAFDACGNVDQCVKTLTVLNAVDPAGDRSEFRAYPTVTTESFSIEGAPGFYFLTDEYGRTVKLIKTK